jgi:hypothetical protein
LEKVTTVGRRKIKFCCEGRRAKVSFRSRSSRPFALSGLITQVRWQTTCATLLCLKFLRKITSAGGKEGLKASSELLLLLLLLLQPDPFLLFVVYLELSWQNHNFWEKFGEEGKGREGRFGWKGFDKASNFDKLFHRFKSPHSCSLGFVESLPSFSWLLRTKVAAVYIPKKEKSPPPPSNCSLGSQ